VNLTNFSTKAGFTLSRLDFNLKIGGNLSESFFLNVV